MKYLIYILLLLSSPGAFSQNFGIGTSNPLARLHVADSNVLFSGPGSIPQTTVYEPPKGLVGANFLWYPQKAAFRAVELDSNSLQYWLKDSIGLCSAAFGYNSFTSSNNSFVFGKNVRGFASSCTVMGTDNYGFGNGAFALGFRSNTRGLYSASFGNDVFTNGDYSFCYGENSGVVGYSSVGIGKYVAASNNYTVAVGYSSSADQLLGISIGSSCRARHVLTLAMGNMTQANMPYSYAVGNNVIVNDLNSLAVGQYNDISATGRVFEVGNGSSSARNSSFAVLLNGNTGIGTVTPTLNSEGKGLHVYNNAFTQVKLQSRVSSAGLEFESGSGKKYELQADYSGNFFLYDRNANLYRLFINTSGKTGIGNTSPASPLSFSNTIEKKVSFYDGPSGDQGIAVAGNDLRIYSDNSNGRVSFGIDNYSGGFTTRAYVQASGTLAMVAQGNMTVNAINYHSDIRFKKNIKPLSDALEKICSLNGVRYELRSSEFPDRNFQPGTQIGLIAQEVEQVFPELVETDEQGYKSVDYVRFSPVLAEAVKSQEKVMITTREQLQQLFQQDRNQENQLDELLKRLDKLERTKKGK